MYCPECRERAQFPWQHDADCVEGLRHKLRWYEQAVFWVLLLLVAETVLLVVAFALLGRIA